MLVHVDMLLNADTDYYGIMHGWSSIDGALKPISIGYIDDI